MSAGAAEASAVPAGRWVNRPVRDAVLAVLTGVAALGGIVLSLPVPLWLQVVGSLFWLVYCLAVVNSVCERWATLAISDRIRWSRPGVEREFHRAAARRVIISRTYWPFRESTDYLLEVEVDGSTDYLLFAEHWLWGGPAHRRARAVAEALGVELHDTARDDSMFRWSPGHRLVAWGHEWLFFLLVVAGLLAAGWLKG